MNNTPNSLRKHIGIFGDTNSGKSTLFNMLINQNMAVVSDKKGTTTDPVKKAMELIGAGPVVFIDTAGTNDTTSLSDLRNKKTAEMLSQVDYALLVCDYKNYNEKIFEELRKLLESKNTEYTIVISKSDTLNEDEKKKAKDDFKEALFVSYKDEASVEKLKEHLALKIKKEEHQAGVLDGLISEGDHLVLVIPVDSEAPKGRLILPQVQTIRDCLDKKAFCHIANEENLDEMIKSLPRVDLVVTDSQSFKQVNETVPSNIKLTSFSMLLARQKGEFSLLFENAKKIDELKDKDVVLISEVCTHNTSHEDIARVKIPALLRKKTGKDLKFEYSSGFSFPEDIEKYSLIIHCGGCMITKKAMKSRLDIIKEKKIPVTNFGVALAYLTGAYERQKFYI